MDVGSWYMLVVAWQFSDGAAAGCDTKGARPGGIGFLILQELFPIFEKHLVKLYQVLVKPGNQPKC